MKNIFLFSFLFVALFFVACDDDDNGTMENNFEYHAHIHSPTAGMKMMGDTLDIEVLFESHSGMTVHHVQVRIYNKADETEIYNMPSDKHVHASSGMYEFNDDVVLNMSNGFEAHNDYILEAKVWGHEAGAGEEMETVEFHVHHE